MLMYDGSGSKVKVMELEEEAMLEMNHMMWGRQQCSGHHNQHEDQGNYCIMDRHQSSKTRIFKGLLFSVAQPDMGELKGQPSCVIHHSMQFPMLFLYF